MTDVPVEQLVRKLGDRDWEVATNAQQALTRAGKKAVPSLCIALLGTDSTIAWRAAWVLGRIKDPEAVPALCEVLTSELPPGPDYPQAPYEDRRALLRAEAAEALGLINDPRAAQALCVALGDSYHTTRTQAEKALKKIGAAASPVLCAALPDLPREGMLLAVKLLGAAGEPEAIAPLCECLQHPHWTVRRAAADALRQLAGRHPVPELRAALPRLRRNLAAWPLAPMELRYACEMAFRTIDAQTRELQAIPLPSGPPAPDTDSLPLPASPGEELEPAEPDARGWKQRLREWLQR